MSDTLTIDLHNRPQAIAAIKETVLPFLTDRLQAGSRWVLTVSRRKRTKPQNRRYWGGGVLAQIASQATVNGRLYSAETWHELAKRKFVGVVELPNGGVIGKSTTELSTLEFAAFCDQVEAWAASELGVTFYDLLPQ